MSAHSIPLIDRFSTGMCVGIAIAVLAYLAGGPRPQQAAGFSFERDVSVVGEYSSYSAGAPVPEWLVNLAHCKASGDWEFGADVSVARTTIGARIVRTHPSEPGYVIKMLGISEGCRIAFGQDDETTYHLNDAGAHQ